MTRQPPLKPRNGTLQGAVTALAAFAIYASHDALIKTLGSTYSPFQIVFFVVLFSFPVVTLMLVRDTKADTLRPREPFWSGIRVIASVIGGFCGFYAFTVLPLAETYAILFAAPLIITVLSIPLLGEVVRLPRWLAVIVGMIGVLVVLRPGSADLGLGHLAALFSASGSALVAVIMRKIGHLERREVLLLYPLLANFAVMLCILPFVYKPMPLWDLGLVLAVSICAVAAMTLIIRAYTLADAALIAPMQYSQMIWATLFGWFFFGETSDLLTFVGAGIIIASGAYIVIRESSAGASTHKPVLGNLSRRPDMGALPRISVVLDADDPNQPEPVASARD